jgi:adenine-specific DNA-methyltransferase
MFHTPNSVDLTTKLTKVTKKENGIFFTPCDMSKSLLDRVVRHKRLTSRVRVLEPSFGSGEFIHALTKRGSPKIYGVELNKTIFDAFDGKATVYNKNYMTWKPRKKFDIIIGNPPYVVCNKREVKEQYQEYVKYCVGRCNLFCLFIVKAIDELRDNGILAFIIPKSIMNSYYYIKVREYIVEQTDIVDIIDYSTGTFAETKQETIGLILRKKHSALLDTDSDSDGDSDSDNNEDSQDFGRYVFGKDYIFTFDKSKLKKLTTPKTLGDLNIKINVGKVVWNQRKSDLKDDGKYVLLYNSNLTSDHNIKLLTFSNKQKKQYINKAVPVRQTFIALNRGNGNTSYEMKFALVKNGTINEKEVVCENHIQVITADTEEVIEKVYKSILNPKTKQYIKYVNGNGGLTTREIRQLPFYDA